jgi:hypothetical protein
MPGRAALAEVRQFAAWRFERVLMRLDCQHGVRYARSLRTNVGWHTENDRDGGERPILLTASSWNSSKQSPASIFECARGLGAHVA